jgi:enoyl-CoA hydratase
MTDATAKPPPDDARALVLVERDEAGCALLTLNRPQAMNALTLSLRAQFVAAVDALAQDEQVRVIVVTGAGRAFCAGLDLRELATPGSAAPLLQRHDTDPIAAILRCPKPIVAAINGVAITGGLELALACDILIGSSEARFADTHCRVGVMPGWGLSQRLSRRIGVGRAKEVSLGAQFIDAAQAAAWGLIDRVVSPESLMPEVRRLAGHIAAHPPAIVAAYKRLIDDGYANGLAAGLAMEAERAQEWNSKLTPDRLVTEPAGRRREG